MKNRSLLLLCLLLPAHTPAPAFEIIFDENGATRRETPAGPEKPIGVYIVNWAKVDLRRQPREVSGDAAAKRPYPVDELQETQVLYGEMVVAYETNDNGWVRVEAPEQPEFTHNNRWQGYPGWVPMSSLAAKPGSLVPNAVVIRRYAKVRQSKWFWSKGILLPMGSRVFVPLVKNKWLQVTGLRGETGWIRAKDVIRSAEFPTQPEDIRRLILAAARQFLGEPYYWGGRAGHRRSEKNAPSGIDCSALVNLGFRAAGYEVPRDSHEQFMASRPLPSVGELRPADLIFLAKEGKPDRMTHVMLYAGGDEVIEAVHEFNVVRRVTIKKKLGRALSEIKPGDRVAGYVVYLGRLVP